MRNGQPNGDGADGLAETLVTAVRAGTRIAAANLLAPETIDAAFRVQAQTAARLGKGVSGWKVGYAPDGTPVAAPLLDGTVLGDGATWTVSAGAAVMIEPELGVRLARDLPPNGGTYTREAILDAIAEVFVGIEIVASRLDDFTRAPFLLHLADRIANGAYAVGPACHDWRGLDLTNLRSVLRLNGETVHDRVASHGNGDPLKPLLDWANAGGHPLGHLRAGQIVTTGSLALPPPARVAPIVAEAEIDGIGRATLRLV